MRLRTLTVATLLASAVVSAVAPRGAAAEVTLLAPHESHGTPVAVAFREFVVQRATRWCWAAVLEAAFRASGHRVAQERFVRAVHGDLVNLRSGPASNVARLLDRTWEGDDGRRVRARLLSLYDAADGSTALDARAVVAALRAGRPLVIGTTSHALLLVGVTFQESGGVMTLRGGTAFDPWPGVGVRQLSAAELTPVTRSGRLAFVADFALDPAE